MKIANLKSAIINEQFFKAMKDHNLTFEALLTICSSQALTQYSKFYPELTLYSNYSGTLDFLLINNFQKINFSQLKRTRYKFLTPFFIRHQQKCASDRDFCLKFIECIQLNKIHFDILFSIYPFLIKTSIHQVDKSDQVFYHNFWITVLKNQNLSVCEINRFYCHCLQNKQYATLLTASKNQFWQCTPSVIDSVIKIRDRK